MIKCNASVSNGFPKPLKKPSLHVIIFAEYERWYFNLRSSSQKTKWKDDALASISGHGRVIPIRWSEKRDCPLSYNLRPFSSSNPFQGDLLRRQAIASPDGHGTYLVSLWHPCNLSELKHILPLYSTFTLIFNHIHGVCIISQEKKDCTNPIMDSTHGSAWCLFFLTLE